MAAPILCYECGNDIGSIFQFTNLAIKGFYKKELDKLNIDVEKMDIHPSAAKPIKFILDAVELNNICCRKSIIGYVDFAQYNL